LVREARLRHPSFKEANMLARDLDLIPNVSDIRQRFTWFEELGWKKL
jgi:hypothetical protein